MFNLFNISSPMLSKNTRFINLAILSSLFQLYISCCLHVVSDMQFRVNVNNMLPVVSVPRCGILNLVRLLCINNTTLRTYTLWKFHSSPIGSMGGPPRPFSPRAAKYLMQTLLVHS